MSDYYDGQMSAGYGDPYDDADTDAIVPGGYGNHTLGWGHPLNLPTLAAIEGNRISDLGGYRRTFIEGPDHWPDGPFTMTVNGIECYSGVAGQGNSLYPNADKSRFVAIMPHLYGVTGLVDAVIYDSAGVVFQTYVNALTVVQHSGRSGVVFFVARAHSAVHKAPAYRRR